MKFVDQPFIAGGSNEPVPLEAAVPYMDVLLPPPM